MSRTPSEPILVVTKRVGEQAFITKIPDTLAGFQEAVEGHIRQYFIGLATHDRPDRLAIVCNQAGKVLASELPINFLLSGEVFRGTVLVAKYNVLNRAVSLTLDEADEWRKFLDVASVKQETAPQPPTPDEPAPQPNDSMMPMLVPRMTDSETEKELPPEEVIDRLMKQFDRKWEILPIEDHREIYDAAIEALKLQEHTFGVEDKETMLLSFEGSDQKYLRIIRFVTDEHDTIIATPEALASFYGIELGEGWEARLRVAVSDSTNHGARCTINAEGVELAPLQDDGEPGLPLAFPFTDADWRSLIAAHDAETVTH